MAWTDITNAQVAAGVRATTALFTALRDNVGAMAEGADGAPKIQKEALGGLAIGVLSGSSQSVTDLDKVEEITVSGGFASSTPSSGVTLSFDLSFSNDNGSTWNTPVVLATITGGASGASLGGDFAIVLNLVTGRMFYRRSTLQVTDTTLTIPVNCDAIRLRALVNTSPSGSLTALYQVTGGRE